MQPGVGAIERLSAGPGHAFAAEADPQGGGRTANQQLVEFEPAVAILAGGRGKAAGGGAFGQRRPPLPSTKASISPRMAFLPADGRQA